MISLPSTVFLLPAIVVSAHLFEEFVWPGEFAAWYRGYRPDRAASITAPYLVTVNLVLVAMALAAWLLGPSPRGIALWLIVASLGASNAVFHAAATWRTRQYSPGLITGLVLYLPIACLGIQLFVVSGVAAPATVVQAALIGPAFHWWSARRHQRRAAVPH